MTHAKKQELTEKARLSMPFVNFGALIISIIGASVWFATWKSTLATKADVTAVHDEVVGLRSEVNTVGMFIRGKVAANERENGK